MLNRENISDADELCRFLRQNAEQCAEHTVLIDVLEGAGIDADALKNLRTNTAKDGLQAVVDFMASTPTSPAPAA